MPGDSIYLNEIGYLCSDFFVLPEIEYSFQQFIASTY